MMPEHVIARAIFAGAVLSGTMAQQQCLDDPSYLTKIGTTCEAVRQAGLDCDGYLDQGFTQEEVDELNAACPSACGRCRGTQCRDDPSYISKIGSTCATVRRAGLDCDGFLDLGFTQEEVDELYGRCPSACGRCCGFEGGCADDSWYVGRFSIDCEVVRRKSFDCWRFDVLGYVSERSGWENKYQKRRSVRGPTRNALRNVISSNQPAHLRCVVSNLHVFPFFVPICSFLV